MGYPARLAGTSRNVNIPGGFACDRCNSKIGALQSMRCFVIKRCSLTVAASVLGLAFVLCPSVNVQAAELRLLAGGAMSSVGQISNPSSSEPLVTSLKYFLAQLRT